MIYFGYFTIAVMLFLNGQTWANWAGFLIFSEGIHHRRNVVEIEKGPTIHSPSLTISFLKKQQFLSTSDSTYDGTALHDETIDDHRTCNVGQQRFFGLCSVPDEFYSQCRSCHGVTLSIKQFCQSNSSAWSSHVP